MEPDKNRCWKAYFIISLVVFIPLILGLVVYGYVEIRKEQRVAMQMAAMARMEAAVANKEAKKAEISERSALKCKQMAELEKKRAEKALEQVKQLWKKLEK